MPREVFDIFLSSTSQDLSQYRDKVRDMVDALRSTTIRMESFGAKPDTPMEVCRQRVSECDALIVIVGHRYGWVPGVSEGGDGMKSITWWEVTWALAAKKPVYAFLVDPAATWNQQREQDLLIDAKTEKSFISIGKSVRWLYEFREYLEKSITRATFTSPEDLAVKVATSLHPWLLEKAVSRVQFEHKDVSRKKEKAISEDRPFATTAEIDAHRFIQWQEQISMLSARALVRKGKKVRLALIAGKADMDHPALSHAQVKHIDVRIDKTESQPDEYTTSLAAFLVAAQPLAPEGLIPNVELLIIQALSHYTTSAFELLAAVEAAIIDGVNVLCITLGSTDSKTEEALVYDRGCKLGMITVGAAGNDPNHLVYPAAYPVCISVSSVDDKNHLAPFAPSLESVTIAAPGVDIPIPTMNAKEQLMSGSTYSCAIASAVVCYMLQVDEELKTPEVREILRNTGSQIVGHASLKVVNAFHALQEVKTRLAKKTKGGERKKQSKRKSGR